jgi:hypothetical protein
MNDLFWSDEKIREVVRACIFSADYYGRVMDPDDAEELLQQMRAWYEAELQRMKKEQGSDAL